MKIICGISIFLNLVFIYVIYKIIMKNIEKRNKINEVVNGQMKTLNEITETKTIEEEDVNGISDGAIKIMQENYDKDSIICKESVKNYCKIKMKLNKFAYNSEERCEEMEEKVCKLLNAKKFSECSKNEKGFIECNAELYCINEEDDENKKRCMERYKKSQK